MMLISVLLLFLIQLTGHITRQNVTFRNDELYEGSPCKLRSGDTGQCKRASRCKASGWKQEERCGFDQYSEPIVCCDVVQAQCGQMKSSSKAIADHVVGDSTLSNPGEFPFMALIKYNHKEVRCGAALISDRFLVTAAHCLTSSEAKPVSVWLGTTDVDDPEAENCPIAKIHKHNEYQRRKRQNDIALLELSRKVHFNDNIKPICLHTDRSNLPESKNLTIMGWGKQEADGDSSKMLLKGTVQPVLLDTCRQRYSTVLNLTEKHMCALGRQNVNRIATDACMGDSGGPLVLEEGGKHFLVGVVSTGSGCGGEPGLYTRVADFIPWIVQQGVWNEPA